MIAPFLAKTVFYTAVFIYFIVNAIELFVLNRTIKKLDHKLYQSLLHKRPVAWRVKDYADGWILFYDENAAYEEAEKTGAVTQGLYTREG